MGRKIVSRSLVITMIIALISADCIGIAYAGELSKLDIGDTKEVLFGDAIAVSEQKKNRVLSYKTSEMTLQDQLNDIYEKVGEELGVPYTYVKAVHLMAGGKAVYSDRSPNIFKDETINSLAGPFEIEGIFQMYDKKSPFVERKTTDIKEGGKYYVPDAAYNVMYSIKTIMDSRETAERGNMQTYFDSLLPDVKQNILFYEAIMKYCGCSDDEVNAIYKAYERIVYLKNKDEYVVEITEDGEYNIKDKFKDVLDRYGIENTNQLAIAMSFDAALAESDTPNGLKSEVPLHYKVDYTSRENMMVAAMSLVGKVKYVWGGGHGGTANINGINPIWACFSELYDDEGKSTSCIQPAGSWCPVHGSKSGQCSISDTAIKTVTDYLNLRGDIIENTSAYANIKGKDLTKIFENGNVAYTGRNGVGKSTAAHRVEGLDCSGFASWLYNQIDDTRTYDSNARNFVRSCGLNSLDFGDPLLPGDVIAWSSHICVTVGKLDDTNKVYLQIESTPNVIKLGVAYYPGATKAQIDKAKAIAKEANILLGNVKDSFVSVYNLENLCYITQATTNSDTGEVNITYTKSLGLGRLARPFKDEDEIISGYDKTMSQMTAKEIIQNTIDSLPIEFLSGADTYKGEIFTYVK